MERLALETANTVDKNIEKILELFPNTATEKVGENGELKRAVDFEKLKQELSEVVVDGEESYDFTWVGKKEAMVEANKPIRKTLRPDRNSSVDWENTQNIYIEGDNLEALKLLQESYLGKVKMIYIDPPYNTGKDFIYRDNFTQDKESYENELGTTNEEGNRLFQNTESNGRFHSDWCSMIYPRLKLARNLLSDDGVIFISIDDNEVRNLKNICDEIFGEENYIGIFSVQNNPKGRKNSKFIAVSNEYCITYSKDKEWAYFKENIPKNSKDLATDEEGNYVHNSGKRVLVGLNNFNKPVLNFSSDKHYVVYYQSQTNKIVLKNETSINEVDSKLVSQGYKRYISFRENYFVENTYTKTKLLKLFDNKALDFKEDKIFEKNFNISTRIKSILDNIQYKAIINNREVDYKLDFKTTSAGLALKELLNTSDAIFTAPKSIDLVKLFMTLFEDKQYAVLDFFSGSATTAHACMQLNAEDGGNRKFIMVQLPELCDEQSEAYKAGYKNICEIGKERIRRAGKKIKEENPDKKIDVGFRVFKVDDTNMKDIYYSPKNYNQNLLDQLESNIKEERTDEDLLYGVLLDWGVELSLPHRVETVESKKVHIVNDDDLIACFEDEVPEGVVRYIANLKPTRAVFKDSSFKTDDHKINVEEIFKLISPDTTVKVI